MAMCHWQMCMRAHAYTGMRTANKYKYTCMRATAVHMHAWKTEAHTKVLRTLFPAAWEACEHANALTPGPPVSWAQTGGVFPGLNKEFKGCSGARSIGTPQDHRTVLGSQEPPAFGVCCVSVSSPR